jgi:hypothetical protein
MEQLPEEKNSGNRKVLEAKASKKTGGEIKFSPRVEVWVLAPKLFGAVKRTNALVLLFLR